MIHVDQGCLNNKLQVWSENDVIIVLGSCQLRSDNASGSTESVGIKTHLN